ncbi:2-methylaconitate cis-trans isomerase PrpF [Rugamonas apoptosis]|uniref:2-methylaconitate cis-trans isomerase PrpF n=1 Tax=Rugamonas apoptosis TaxID=2758570 RepID=A0A7W2FFG3_9BURK|nr:2-methylaconitate cis-trans isomerase PrpF [Rugamonas apoptosis]MBA5690657.1 2-methylaconitate cis-trans isomerase PrpF [Rugamonas apoptosis]
MTKQFRIPAVYMRGGTSKGVFFRSDSLPADPILRDQLLLRVIGSPDPYGQQIDGMGGGTSSTSKVVLVSRSNRPDCDVDYLFGAVAVGSAVIDWSGNCGNLSSAVGPFAITEGLMETVHDGVTSVRIWQANIGKRIVAHVPTQDGQVTEYGNFELDGVTFPAAEIKLDFLDLGGDDTDANEPMFPTGNVTDTLSIPEHGTYVVTYINAGNPAIFIDAAAIGLSATESQQEVNQNATLLARCEAIRSHGAVAMGLASTPEQASRERPHTPKLAFFAPPRDAITSSGKQVRKEDIDLSARILSMGKLHHAMTGTGAIGIAAAAAIPGTVVHRLSTKSKSGQVRFGHPSGTLTAGAVARLVDDRWMVTQASMSRSARRLMDGWVYVVLP